MEITNKYYKKSSNGNLVKYLVEKIEDDIIYLEKDDVDLTERAKLTLSKSTLENMLSEGELLQDLND